MAMIWAGETDALGAACARARARIRVWADNRKEAHRVWEAGMLRAEPDQAAPYGEVRRSW